MGTDRVMRALIAALALWLGASTSAIAQSTSPATTDAAATFSQAVDALTARLGSIEGGTPAIGFADPQVRTQLQAIDNAMGQFGTAAFPVDGLNSFDNVCGRLNAINVRYALDGLAAYRAAGGALGAQQLMRFSARNVVRFQDETAILTARLVQCQAQHMPAMVTVVASLPEGGLTEARLRGLRSMRISESNMILGIMINARDGGMRPVNRMRLLHAAGQWSPLLARQMTLSDRQALAATIRTMRPALTGTALEQQAAILSALANDECVELCLIG